MEPMKVMSEVERDQRRARYHHGDLREALIGAAYDLVLEKGADAFLLSDACRCAGVSTAAPYKHFRDRDEILECVCERGFEELTERSMAAVAAAGPGTIDGIKAMGQSYVRFAVEKQMLFRLMFGQHPKLKQADHVIAQGRDCFGSVIEEVARFCRDNGVAGDPQTIAVRLWTFVHGAASLLIDEDYDKVAPDLDVALMIEDATPMLLGLGPRNDGA